jgi:hypothetical protein
MPNPSRTLWCPHPTPVPASDPDRRFLYTGQVGFSETDLVGLFGAELVVWDAAPGLFRPTWIRAGKKMRAPAVQFDDWDGLVQFLSFVADASEEAFPDVPVNREWPRPSPH